MKWVNYMKIYEIRVDKVPDKCMECPIMCTSHDKEILFFCGASFENLEEIKEPENERLPSCPLIKQRKLRYGRGKRGIHGNRK